MSIETHSVLNFADGHGGTFEPFTRLPLLVTGADESVQYRIVYREGFDDGGFFPRGGAKEDDSFGAATGKPGEFVSASDFVCASSGSCTIRASMTLVPDAAADFIVTVKPPIAALVSDHSTPADAMPPRAESDLEVSVVVTSKSEIAVDYGRIRFSISDPGRTGSKMAGNNGEIGAGTFIDVDLNEFGAAQAVLKVMAGVPGNFNIRATFTDPSAPKPAPFADIPFKIAVQDA